MPSVVQQSTNVSMLM